MREVLKVVRKDTWRRAGCRVIGERDRDGRCKDSLNGEVFQG